MDQVVDRYKVRDLLGSGAFADVFRAEHVHLERPVALKILRPELAARKDVVERFLAEAKVVSRIHHPGVVEVYDFGQAKGVPFMALQLVEGTNLRDHVKPGGLPLAEVRSLGRDLCQALGAAHKAGVIHRDL
ncbi:MAG TPA: serine/threonine protein kinase, partial [Planctomycetes bacterium]|nr:serine/threonine protein kinase [Planctomycetota bacterium]